MEKYAAWIVTREIKRHNELSPHPHNSGENSKKRMTSVGEDAQQPKLMGV
jgi:hypothetical protein